MLKMDSETTALVVTATIYMLAIVIVMVADIKQGMWVMTVWLSGVVMGMSLYGLLRRVLKK